MKYPIFQGILVVSLMLFVVPALYADDVPTAQECLVQYMKSPAAASCEAGPGQTDVVVTDEGQCQISDTCPKEAGQPRRATVTVPVNRVMDLVNCNGTLLLDYCPE